MEDKNTIKGAKYVRIAVDVFLSNFYRGTKNVRLNGIKFLCESFNHPEKDLKFIHIAGTNGKGSCAEMMTNILINAGYKVGKFISPHLIKYNERISINNKNITDDEMEALIKKIIPIMNEYSILGSYKITFFELETIMAFLYFKENNCDFVVLEVGLGGLYDSTNIVNPLISIITSVGYDHMNILGNTLEKIAEQKAGIIKQDSDTIFVEQEEEVNNVIKQTCINKNNNLHLIEKQNITNYSYDMELQKFDYKKYKNVETNLKGEKQIYNASICLEAVDILNKKSYKISEKNVKDGLKTVVHKGRFETISEKPLIIYDGAHNKPAIENFINSVNMYYNNNKKVYIISILKRKDYESMLKLILKDEKSIFIFTDGNNKEMYEPKEELLKIAKKCTTNQNLYIEDLETAINLTKEKYSKYVTFIIGSFYIYGDVINYLNKKEN